MNNYCATCGKNKQETAHLQRHRWGPVPISAVIIPDISTGLWHKRETVEPKQNEFDFFFKLKTNWTKTPAKRTHGSTDRGRDKKQKNNETKKEYHKVLKNFSLTFVKIILTG